MKRIYPCLLVALMISHFAFGAPLEKSQKYVAFVEKYPDLNTEIPKDGDKLSDLEATPNAVFALQVRKKNYSEDQLSVLATTMGIGSIDTTQKKKDIVFLRNKTNGVRLGHDTRNGCVFFDRKADKKADRPPQERKWYDKKAREQLKSYLGETAGSFVYDGGSVEVATVNKVPKFMGRTYRYCRVAQGRKVRGVSAFARVFLNPEGDVNHVMFNSPDFEVQALNKEALKSVAEIETELEGRANEKEFLLSTDGGEIRISKVVATDAFDSYIPADDREEPLLVPAVSVLVEYVLENGKQVPEEWRFSLVKKN